MSDQAETGVLAFAETHSLPSELILNQRLERRIANRRTHTYRISLNSGEFVRGTLNQKGIDMRVTTLRPDGTQIADFDTGDSATGPGPFFLVAESAGAYQIHVSPVKPDASEGAYEIILEERHPATSKDQARQRAILTFQEGEHLRQIRTAVSLQQAIGKYTEVLALYGDLQDDGGQAKTHGQLGLVYGYLGDLRRALAFNTRALELRRGMGDQSAVADSLANVGQSYSRLGEYQTAQDYYQQALIVFQSLQDRSREASILNDLGMIYSSVGDARSAVMYYERALPLWRMVGSHSGEATTLNNMGGTYYAFGEYQKALDYYGKVIQLNRAISYRFGEAVTTSNIGRVYTQLGEYSKAREYYRQALSFSAELGDKRAVAKTLHNLAWLHYKLGDREEAAAYYSQSLDQMRSAGDRPGEMTILYGIARLARDRGNLDEARARIEEVLRMSEDLRASITGQQLRATYLASVQDYYELYIDTLMQLDDQDSSLEFKRRALEASERQRARTLLDLLNEAKVDIRQGVDPTLLNREKEALQRLNERAEEYVRSLSSRDGDKQASALNAEIERLILEHQELEARTRADKTSALRTKPLSAQEIQDMLGEDDLLLEYSLGEAHSYLWAVTRDSVQTVRIGSRTDIEIAAKRCYTFLTSRTRANAGETSAQWEKRIQEADAGWLEAATELSRVILTPIAPILGRRRLTIVGDGALNYVPFGALPTPSNVRGPAARLLVDDHEIINLPSASVQGSLRQSPGVGPLSTKTVAVFADPVFDTKDPRVPAVTEAGLVSGVQLGISERAFPGDVALERATARVGLADEEFRLPRLVFTRQEADGIRALAKDGDSMMAIGFDATLKRATNPDLAQFRIVHFATHGILNSDHPELSGLVFSLLDERGRTQPGFLNFAQIYNLQLPVDLIVLSACQTALGQEIRGEGLVGLTRGFMYAGAKHVVASLWEVDDAATAELMRRFYSKMLRDRQPPATALREAQLEVHQTTRWSAPYYWAAFTIQGE